MKLLNNSVLLVVAKENDTFEVMTEINQEDKKIPKLMTDLTKEQVSDLLNEWFGVVIKES
jgi:hypothetical protein